MKYSFKCFCLLIILSTIACKKHDHKNDDYIVIGHNHEVITTLILSLKDSATQQKTQFQFKDVDGYLLGNYNGITKDSVKLKENTTYNAEIILLNETKTPLDSISPLIKAQKNTHQFFYSTVTIPLNIVELDKDFRNLPFGIKAKFKTGSKTNNNKQGLLSIEMSHFDNESKKNGIVRSDETDIKVDFNVLIQ